MEAKTVGQYNKQNIIVDKTFITTRAIIQLRLKIEEIAMISMVLFLLICRVVPVNEEATKNGNVIFLVVYNIKIKGAPFCQVSNKELVENLNFLFIERNHWWKGEAAIFKTILRITKIALISRIRISLVTYTQKINRVEPIT